MSRNLLLAIAVVNGHPDPNQYADDVEAAEKKIEEQGFWEPLVSENEAPAEEHF